ncbi:hypothetical protein GB937_010723 [Aspergillus fischeri]|nr:hypothetical protein GB937_010723 [Aspergillus fischeri]
MPAKGGTAPLANAPTALSGQRQIPSVGNLRRYGRSQHHRPSLHVVRTGDNSGGFARHSHWCPGACWALVAWPARLLRLSIPLKYSVDRPSDPLQDMVQ